MMVPVSGICGIKVQKKFSGQSVATLSRPCPRQEHEGKEQKMGEIYKNENRGEDSCKRPRHKCRAKGDNMKMES
jgi:hypothetical protein